MVAVAKNAAVRVKSFLNSVGIIVSLVTLYGVLQGHFASFTATCPLEIHVIAIPDIRCALTTLLVGLEPGARCEARL